MSPTSPARKRTSGAAGLPPPGSPARESPAKVARRARLAIQDKVQAVTEALTSEALMPVSVPRHVLEMLAMGAPHALASAVEDRQPLQAKVLGHIQEVFAEALDGLTAGVTTAQTAVDGKNGEVTAAQAVVEATDKDIAGEQSAIEDQRARLADREGVLSKALQEAKVAESHRKANARERESLAKQRDAMKAVEEGGLHPLLEGAFPTDAEVKKACAKFIKDMEKLGAERSLLDSATAVMLKPKEQRMGFDQMVIDSLRAFLMEKVSAADAAVEACTTAGRDIEASVAATALAVENSRQARDGDVELLQSMQQGLQAKEQLRKDQVATVEGLSSELAARVGAHADAQETLQALQEAKDTLEALVTRSSAGEPGAEAMLA